MNIKFDIYESESQYYALAKKYINELIAKEIAFKE
jgi:hypothetical protein